MKKLSILCALVMVFSVSLVQAQQYQLAPAGGKAFSSTADINVGGTIALDIWLQGAPAAQNAGGALIDFSGSTDDLAFVSGGRCMIAGAIDEGCVGPWTNGAGSFQNEPLGTGTVLYIVGNLGGAAPDGDGDLIVGTVTLLNTGTLDATVDVTVTPLPTWTPLADSDAAPGQIVISAICPCTTDSDCDDGNFCNGAETCDVPTCTCEPAVSLPCPDDANICTLDCDEDTDSCLDPVICDDSQIVDSFSACCLEEICETNSLCAADITLTKQSGFYQPPADCVEEVVTVKNKICLNNPSDLVGGIQFDICDSPDCLTCIDCELTERTVMFDCVVLELPNGCCRVIMFCKNPGCAINPGECDIVTVVMQSKTEYPEGVEPPTDCGQDCIVEVLEGIVASDYDGYPLLGSGVSGSVCPVVCGDVCPPGSGTANDCGDGVVDIYDIMCEVDLALTATTANDCQAPRADVPTGTPPNCTAPDGEINILDIMVLIDSALNRQDCCSFYYLGIIY